MAVRSFHRYIHQCNILLGMSFPVLALACGPSPQKVSHEVMIQATPEKVWSTLHRFDAMHLWHPMVQSTDLNSQDSPDAETALRTLQLKQGGWLTQRQRSITHDVSGEWKLAYAITGTSLPFTNYSDQLVVKSGPINNQTKVIWTGRFTNQANAMDAPFGRDNAAAIEAVERFYFSGLEGLKQYLESNQ